MLLYTELAPWWPLMSAPEEYAEEAAFYLAALTKALGHAPESILELGSGGGNNASHIKQHSRMVLVEPAAGMRAVSRVLNPELEHIEGDMRTVRLDRQFDAVFVHDAVCYMTTLPDLTLAIETAAVHCRPGGVVLFAPDHVRENFAPGEDCGGNDAPDGRGLRYLEWCWDPDPADDTYTVDYAYLVREANGFVRMFHDRHIEGLFARADWLRLMSEAGLEPTVVPFEHSEITGAEYEVYVGVKGGPHAAD